MLGEETEVKNYLNKLAPHLILAVASCTSKFFSSVFG